MGPLARGAAHWRVPMKSKTHIVVVRMREIIYTALFLVFAILLILLLVFMFSPKDKRTQQSAPLHRPLMCPASIPPRLS